jgi:uracil phosphoribosyltransferase
MKDFRDLLDELSMLMVYEITKDFPLVEVEIETPMAKAKTKVLSDKKVALVPILRAGIGMVHGIQQLLPNARVGHIGLYRVHDTCLPVEYYCKLPSDIADSTVIMLDPMFATGGSISAALKILKDKGCQDIRLVCIVAARPLTRCSTPTPISSPAWGMRATGCLAPSKSNSSGYNPPTHCAGGFFCGGS